MDFTVMVDEDAKSINSFLNKIGISGIMYGENRGKKICLV